MIPNLFLDYLPNTWCAIDHVLVNLKRVMKDVHQLFAEVAALRKTFHTVADPSRLERASKVPSQWEEVDPELHPDFPTADLQKLHDFFRNRANWDMADAHMLKCMELSPDHQFMSRWCILVLTSFLVRRIATKTAWGFGQ